MTVKSAFPSKHLTNKYGFCEIRIPHFLNLMHPPSIMWTAQFLLGVWRGGISDLENVLNIFLNIVACLLKDRIVKPAETAVAMERLCKYSRC
jgi:hypothetical protein